MANERTFRIRFTGDSASAIASMEAVKAAATSMGATVTSSATASTAAASKGITSTLTSASTFMHKMGDSLYTLGRRMSFSISLPLAAVGGSAIKMALDFEEAMKKVETLSGQSAQQVKAWTADVLELSKETGISAKALADGLYYTASAGLKVTEVMGVMKLAAKGSALGMGSVTQVANTLTTAINAYGSENMSAAQAADVLTRAIQLGRAEPAEFGDALGNIIAPAEALGIKLPELAGALTGLSNIMPDVHEDATGLRQVFNALNGVSREGAKTLEAHGLSMAKVRDIIKDQGLFAALKTIHDAVKNDTDAQNRIFGNVRAYNAFAILLGQNAQENKEIIDQLTVSAGTFEDSWKKLENSPKQKLKIAMEELKAAGIGLGNVLIPIVVKIAEKVGDMADWFDKLSPTTKKFVGYAILLGAALGPVLLALAGVSLAVGILLNPITWITVGIAALAAGVIYLYQRFEFLQPIMKVIGLAIAIWYFPIIGIILVIKKLVEILQSMKILEKLKDWFGTGKEAVGNFLGKIGDLIQYMRDLPGKISAALVSFGSTVWNGLVSGLNYIRDNFWYWLGYLIGMVIAVPVQMAAALLGLGVFIWGVIVDSLTYLKDNIGGWIASVVDFFVQLPGRIGGLVSEVVSTVARFFSELPGRVINAISSLGSKLFTAAKEHATRFGDGARETFQKVVDGIKELPGAILHALKGLGSLLYDVGKDLIKGLIRGIEDAAKDLAGVVGKLASGIKNGFKDALNIKSPSKVMHELGVFTSLGLIEGIESKNKDVSSALQAQGGIVGLDLSTPSVSTNYSQGSSIQTAAVSPITINLTVTGSVTSERDLINAIQEGLLKKQRNNVTLGFA